MLLDAFNTEVTLCVTSWWLVMSTLGPTPFKSQAGSSPRSSDVTSYSSLTCQSNNAKPSYSVENKLDLVCTGLQPLPNQQNPSVASHRDSSNTSFHLSRAF